MIVSIDADHLHWNSPTIYGLSIRGSIAGPITLPNDGPGHLRPIAAPTLALSRDTGVSATDRVTSDATVVGVAQPGATVTAFVYTLGPGGATTPSERTLATVTADPVTGAWTMPSTAFPETGSRETTFLFRSTDANGVLSGATTYGMTVNRTAPSLVVRRVTGDDVISLSESRSPIAIDGIAFGSLTSNIVVKVDGIVAGSVTPDSQGRWSATIDGTPLFYGPHTITVEQVDRAGNFGSYSQRILGGHPSIEARDLGGDGRADILWLADDGHLRLWNMNLGFVQQDLAVTRVEQGWSAAAVTDFTGDQRADMLWRSADGQVRLWTMQGAQIVSDTGVAQNVGAEWHVAGARDFTGDGVSDLLWMAEDGHLRLWTMAEGAIRSDEALGTPQVGRDWRVAGTGDFTGDGRADILWRSQDGSLRLWEMDGPRVRSDTALSNPSVPTNWNVAATGDYSGDGRADILWRSDDGQVRMWTMNGSTVASDIGVAQGVGAGWSVADSAPFHRDANDRGADLLWRHTDGSVRLWDMGPQGLESDNGLAQVPTEWRIVNDHHDFW